MVILSDLMQRITADDVWKSASDTTFEDDFTSSWPARMCYYEIVQESF